MSSASTPQRDARPDVGTPQDLTRLADAEQELRAATERVAELERLLAERTAAMAAGEEHFRRLIEHAHDIAVIIDGEGRAIYGSPSVQRVLGYDPERYRGESLVPFFHPDDAPRVVEWLAGLGRDGATPARIELRFRHADGHWVHLEAIGTPTAQGRPELGHVVNCRDVTERREAEHALRTSEERYRALVEQLPGIVYTTASLEPGYPTTFVSPQVGQLLGHRAEEWYADPERWLKSVHEEDRDRVRAAWEAAHAAGTPFSAEYRMHSRDGRVLWFRDEARQRRDATGRPLDIQGVMVDVTERKEAELALQKSEERWRAMLENAHDMVTIIDLEGVMRYQSPALTRVMGYAPEELVGRSAFDYMHPDDVPGVREQMWRLVAEPGSVGHAEYRFRHKDGNWRDMEAFGRTLSPSSVADGIVANVRDITERRAVELALQRSEEHFRRLIEHSYDLVQVLSPEGNVVYTGPSVQRLLGYTPEEIAGMTIPDFMHPDDLPAAGALVASILANPGTPGSLQYRVRHKDGTWRWLEVWARTLSPTSAEEGIVANARDITDRREAERALKESEEHFRRLIENGNDLLMISRPDGTLTYVSPSMRRVWGYDPEWMLGKRPTDLVHPEDVHEVMRTLAAAAAQPGTVHRLTFRACARTGEWRVMEVLNSTLDPASADAGIMCNLRDITEQRAAERELRQAKAEAEQAREEAERANRAKSEFLSRMSHELRTPLNSILGFAQVLEDVELPPEYRTGLRHILNGGRHLLNLINEVLDIARIEAGHQAMSIEPVRLGSVIGEAVDMVRPLAAARGVWIAAIPHPADGRYVSADRQRLAQVLLNLLSNAVKYNRPQGAVRIGCEPVRDERHPAGVERLRIRVTDEGSGIAPERRDELFVPFSRLGAEHTGVEGTGLGLALSQRLVQAMGGTLLLERSGPDGSAFAVDLEPATDPLTEVPVRRSSGGFVVEDDSVATLLYVEDNLANLSLVETILLPRPAWRVVPALQGQLGVELAREHLPDVILLDLHLPDIPGHEVLRQLRADPRTAATPVIVISADATPRTKEVLLAAGADDFLTKPLDVRVFLATVEQAIAGRRRPPTPPDAAARA